MEHVCNILKILISIPLLIAYVFSFGVFSFSMKFPDDTTTEFKGWLF